MGRVARNIGVRGEPVSVKSFAYRGYRRTTGNIPRLPPVVRESDQHELEYLSGFL